MSDFLKDIEKLKSKVRCMDARLKELEGEPVVDDGKGLGIPIMETLEIKMIARARARGDKGQLKEWKRRQKEKLNGTC